MVVAQEVVLENTELLNQYYDQRALSSLPNGYNAFFQFGDLDWGYDLIETVDGKPSCKDIPLDKTSIANVFYTSKANYTYVNGNIVITASLPAGTFPAGESHQFSCVGIKDTNKNLIGVAVTQPVWIYSDRGISIEIIIKTARSDSAQVAVGA
ncbi:hypothetical protein [Vibrio marisflavi]|uniref:Uncharacterized protein n=1 Tax=Vibrio marisflavi CECT 7928 TaxID=634439 RepID=A0ABN8E9F0_9VIBR|nr:hypothetical protein [Vibrio marisflavi]CAH0543064.1 hypothetical protein VMF7928_04384 [Vibrio marisflavi CECT 7928]